MAKEKIEMPVIDKRIEFVGTSRLRKLNADALRKFTSNVMVVQDSEEPIAVVMGYGLYMKLQRLALALA